MKTNLKKTIPTRLALLVIILVASLGWSMVRLSLLRYQPPEVENGQSAYLERARVHQLWVKEHALKKPTITKKFADGYYLADGYVTIDGVGIRANPETFEYLGHRYSRDKDLVYYGYLTVDSADRETFFVSSEGVAKDKNFTFSGADPLIDASLLRVIDYKKNRENYYTDGTFVYVKRDFSEEKYYPLIGVDPLTFEFVDTCVYAERSGAPYIKDKNFVWCAGFVLKDADPKTFKKIGMIESSGEIPMGTSVARDATHMYFGSRLLEGVDTDTAEVVGNSYLKDKDNVYRLMGHSYDTVGDVPIMEGVNPADCLKENLKGCEAPQ